MKKIVKLQVTDLQKRLSEKNIKLSVLDDAIEWLANRGYDPLFGARPLKRLIQNQIQDSIAEGILCGKILNGKDVSFSVKNDKLIIDNI